MKKAKNRGITLIALIITIVVMLILLGVSVDLIIDGKIFTQAETAVDKTNNKVDQQQGRIDELMGELDAVVQSQKETETHNWTRTGDTITCSHCSTTVTIGQQLNYTKTGTGTSSITGANSGVSQGITDGKLTASNFGTNGLQTISKNATTNWVVLGIEDSDNNGTKETLLLTTEPTTEKIRMYGAAAYNNIVTELDRMCKELYGEDARSITIEDVNNCLNCVGIESLVADNYYGKTPSTCVPSWGDESFWPETGTTVLGNSSLEALEDYTFNSYVYFLSQDGNYLVATAGGTATDYSPSEAAKEVIYGEVDASIGGMIPGTSFEFMTADQCFDYDTGFRWGCGWVGYGQVSRAPDICYTLDYYQGAASVWFPIRPVLEITQDISDMLP